MVNLKQYRRTLLYRIAQCLVERATMRTVVQGPFKGVRYPRSIQSGNALHAKWLGCYEAEIRDMWTRLSRQHFDLIVDVGAAEGFYVVGLARLFPKASVVAFEAGVSERHAMRELVEVNGIANVVVKGWCDLQALTEIGRGSTGGVPSSLLIMDVEGAEYDLLVPEEAPWLAHAVILVECHRFKGEPGADVFIERFRGTHDAEIVKSRQRLLGDLPWRCPRIFEKWLLHVSSDEREGLQEWLLLVPRAPAQAAVAPQRVLPTA